MNLPEYRRAMRIYWLWIHLNADGRKGLAAVFGEDLLAALIVCVERYLAKEGE